MANDKLLNGLATFASGYVKRWMESNYDALMRLAPARTLMASGRSTRHGVEAALYALLAYADQHWSSQTPLGRLLREVVMDAPSEISKRMLSGFREEVLSSAGAQASGHAKSFEQVLLRLDDATLGALLAWLGQTSPEDRARIRKLFSALSDEEMRKVAHLAPEALDALVSPAAPSEKPPRPLSRALGDALERAHKRVDEQLAARRMRRRR